MSDIVSECKATLDRLRPSGTQFRPGTLSQIDRLESVLSLCIHELQRRPSGTTNYSVICQQQDLGRLRTAVLALRQARDVVQLELDARG